MIKETFKLIDQHFIKITGIKGETYFLIYDTRFDKSTQFLIHEKDIKILVLDEGYRILYPTENIILVRSSPRSKKFIWVCNNGWFISKRLNKILTGETDENNYVKYRSWDDNKHDRKRVSFLIHIEIALAFIPNPEHKPTVNHLDGNKQNNHISNLDWATYSEQLLHAFRMGLRENKKGPDNPAAKFTAEEVKFIREIIHETTVAALARHFGVDPKTIRSIVNRESYTNVP